MLYTLDIKVLSTKEEFRLTQLSNWRTLSESWRFQEGDKPYQEYESLLQDKKVIEKSRSVKLGSYPMTIPDRSLVSAYELIGSPILLPRLHRTEKPRLFTKEELVRTIRAGDDSRDNVLVVTLQGYFALGNTEYMFKVRDGKVPVAVRHGTFIAGNNYIGREVARDNEHITKTYLAALHAWYMHLINGELDVFADFALKESEIGLREKIKRFRI